MKLTIKMNFSFNGNSLDKQINYHGKNKNWRYYIIIYQLVSLGEIQLDIISVNISCNEALSTEKSGRYILQ